MSIPDAFALHVAVFTHPKANASHCRLSLKE